MSCVKDRLKLLAVSLVLILQVSYIFDLTPTNIHGEILDISYRRKERMAAFWDDRQNPSPEAHAKFLMELKRMHRYELVIIILKGGVLLTIDVFGIRYLMRREEPAA